MNQLYKSRWIYTLPRLSADADCWIPRAVVSWDENGEQRRWTINGPDAAFKLIEHADLYALEMAMAWIDAQMVEDIAT